MANFRSVEPQLSSLRKAAYTGQLSGVQTEEWYVRIQHPLSELSNELGYGTGNSAAFGRTLYAVSLAKAAESLTRSIGTHILVEKTTSPAVARPPEDRARLLPVPGGHRAGGVRRRRHRRTTRPG